ncbi:MAG: D-tyrosyl-tRNA(Tyr) deacylase [Alistipes sp.]|jgi:D-tyrosyl-tRNA(Tyr) deacylase|nr:D-tyrosyl-tRNA(Tyr) deacylase [Alistipes sp.]MEE0864785.1 D-aminoacyl-tRNA deacylase [Alistipes sp.]
MRILIQRVTEARCRIAGEVFSEIGGGMVVLVGVGNDETREDVEWLAKKLVQLRIFDDEAGVMNLSVQDVAGEIMVVSQFTLHAMTKKGNRPSWIKAAPEAVSRPLYEEFVSEVERLLGRSVATGSFGADMQIELINDGPVTIWIDSKSRE